MDAQHIWNFLTAALLAAGGGALSMLYAALRDLTLSDQRLLDRLQRFEVLVAGEYVKTDDLDATIQRLFQKLDAIEAKLDTKVSRHECPVIHANHGVGGAK